MESPERGALTLVRVVGVALVLATVFELGLYWAVCANPKHPQPVELGPVLVRLIWALAGILVLIKARAIAEWISNIFE